MESNQSQGKPMDEAALAPLVSDFNAITQNQDQAIAAHYLEMSNYDLNKAITLFMENPPSFAQTSSQSQPTNPSPRQNINNAIFEQMADFPFFQPGNNNSGNSLTNQVNTYKQFYREKEKRDVEYEFHVISNIYKTSANAVKSIWNKIVPIAIRGETPGGEEFTCFLHKSFGKIRTCNFIHGNVLENVDWAISKNHRMLLVFIYAIEPANFKELQQKLLTNEGLSHHVNENFVIMGLLQNKNETNKIKQLYPEIKEPCILAFRKNLYEKYVIIDQIPINETLPEPSQYIERLNGVKTLCNAQILEEETIKKKALQEISLENQSRYFGYPGNQFFSYYDDFNEYPYGNRPSQSRAQDPEVQRKLQTDRMLKKQQEEEYKLAQRLAEEQQTKKQKEIDEKKLQEERKRIEEEEKVNFEKIQQEALKQKRAQLQPEPPIGDPDLFEVLFRLPNGNKISRRFRKSDGIEVLYIYIETLEGLPFKATTQFDIIRTMPSLNLSDKKNQKISEVFEDSNQEMFHIREID